MRAILQNSLVLRTSLAGFVLVMTAITHAGKPADNEDQRPAIENIHRLSPRLLSGGEPLGDAAFSELAELGVRTIVSVDGARPDVAAAKKHGLRYVHIPIGYDGVGSEAQAALTRVVRESTAPVFVHCHHGKHRGPAAAAMACLAAGDMTAAQATAYLALAGTSKDYAGLWRSVARFEPLPADAELPPLVETAEVDSLAAAMADLDRAWDRLKLCHDAGWATPAEHVDLAPQHEALLAWEALRESRRTLPNESGPMGEQLDAAIDRAASLRQSLRQDHNAAATRAFERLDQSCQRCHSQYRN